MNVQIEDTPNKISVGESIAPRESIQIALKRSAKKRFGISWNKSESILAWGQPSGIADELEKLNQCLVTGNELTDFGSSVESLKNLGNKFSFGSDSSDSTLPNVLQGLSLAYQLNRFAGEEKCAEMVESLLSTLRLKEHFDPLTIPTSGTQLLITQLTHIEFPLVIVAQCFAGLSKCDLNRLVIETTKRFETLLDATTDGDGWVESCFFEQFWPLAASWSRTFQLLHHFEIQVNNETRQQLEWICRQFLRSMGPDGKQMLGANDQYAASLKFQETVIALSLDRVDKKLARLRDPNRESKKKDDINLTLFDENGFSEWASSGIIQSGWGSHSPRVAISANQTNLKLEMSARVSLIRGQLKLRVWFNGQQLEFFRDEHEIRCWHSDERVEYIELEYQLDQGATLERQILLGREDHFVLIADAIHFAESGEIQYEHRLPLSPNISVLCESETREVYLKDKQIESLVLPLGLGEWKADGARGSLNAEQGDLLLKQSCVGRAIYAPLFFDLSPQRSKRPRTWRHLTVAEDRVNLKKDQAAAFRIQIGKEQWLICRNLDGSSNRTFMGENHIGEFFVGRSDGVSEAEELLEIE